MGLDPHLQFFNRFPKTSDCNLPLVAPSPLYPWQAFKLPLFNNIYDFGNRLGSHLKKRKKKDNEINEK